MNVRRTARQMAPAFAVVILPLVLACGNDDGTGTDENPLVGSWSATLRDLPAVTQSVIPDFADQMDALMRRRKGHLAAMLGGGGEEVRSMAASLLQG